MTASEAVDAALTPTSDPAWILRSEGFDPLREASLESRFAISNGLIGVRGARSITRGVVGAPGARTYIAGLFGTPNGELVSPGLAPAADWLEVQASLPDGPMVRHPADVAAHERTLDFRRGALLSRSRLLAADGAAAGLEISVRTLRLTSQSARAIGLQVIRFEVLAGAAEVTFEALIDGTDHGLVVERLDPEVGVWRAMGSGRSLAMAVGAWVWIDGDEHPPEAVGPLSRTWSWAAKPGRVMVFARLAAFVRSDVEADDPADDARQALAGATRSGWPGVLADHEAAWAARWAASDVEVEGDAEAQHALRFALHHLNGAANPEDDHVSIAARALTGDDYRGHVFWDTEIYLTPFFITTWPAAARALLMYRFLTLDGAREKAARLGWRGALYAWESADSGAETTPREVVGPDRQIIQILTGVQEQHISADVAYAVWRYWQATDDDAFLRQAGAEILFETARFWASRALSEADGRRHIRGVIGPDEYHEDIDDNAYTNVMARWTLARAIDVAALLKARWPDVWVDLASRLSLTAAELADWSDAAATIATGLDAATGLYDQFEGFRGLEAIDLAAYAGRSVPMDVVLGRDRIQHAQVVKQADVVALIGLLPEIFEGESAAANFDYYAPRCSHGSSLSRAMHGLVAARLGLADQALAFFRRTAEIDLGDSHAASDGGVHIAALGGLWMIAVFGFAGLSLTDRGLALAPKMPGHWTALRFSVQWRGRTVGLRIEDGGRRIDAALTVGEAMTLTVAGAVHDLAPGRTVAIVVATAGGEPTTAAAPTSGA